MYMLLKYTLYLTFLLAHPLHVSVTNVEIDPRENEITVSYRFFTDDFSLLFFHLYEKNITPVENTDFSTDELSIIEKYLSDAFQVQPAGSSLIHLDYEKKVQNENSIWLYFKGKLPPGAGSQLTFTNKIMLDLYWDQTNLVIIASGGREKGLTFNNKNQEYTVDMKD